MTSRRRRHQAQALAVLLGLWAMSVSLAQTDTFARVVHIVARVHDGFPAGLSPADIVVREDGRPRRITSVESASPTTVALVVDPALGGAGLEVALSDFLVALDGRAPVAVFSADGQRIGAPTADTSALKQLVRIFERPVVLRAVKPFDPEAGRPAGRTAFGPRAFALHGIMSAADHLAAGSGRPGAIVVVMVGGDGDPGPLPPIQQRVRDSGASLRAAVFVGADDGPRGPSAAEETLMEGVVAEAARASGGRREFITRIDRDLGRVLTDFAAELTNQYAVTYLRPPDTAPVRLLEVSSTQSGVSVSAPRWAP